MEFHFYKYQATGNDFIILDCMNQDYPLTKMQIARLCNRRFGIGADGLIKLLPSAITDFKMTYFNSDGAEGSMCGNGGRCIASFAFENKYSGHETAFEAIDGIHHASLEKDKDNSPIVALVMGNVREIKAEGDMAILHTGSPHFIRFVQNAVLINVVEEGRKVRYSSSYKADGINVNFVEVKPGSLFIRTYERGVEDETLSCGTGVTAAVLAAAWTQRIPGNRACNVNTPGGELQVSFTMNEQGFTNVVLKGPADFVFKGIIDL